MDSKEAIDAYIDGYEPKRVELRRLWHDGIRDIAVPAVKKVNPPSVKQATNYLTAMTKIAAWSLDRGMPLDIELILDPTNVERWATEAGGDRDLRMLQRSQLRRLGRHATERAPWEPLPKQAYDRPVADPYTPAEVKGLKAVAGSSGDQHRIRVFRTMLALGLGAGLDGRWVPFVRPGDVYRSDEAVVVRVGDPAARVVPVLAEWEDEFLSLACNVPSDEALMAPGPNHKQPMNTLTRKLYIPRGLPALKAARLRSTWIVHHLTVGTPVCELADAAGFQHLGTIGRLARAHVPRLARSDHERVLRGA